MQQNLLLGKNLTNAPIYFLNARFGAGKTVVIIVACRRLVSTDDTDVVKKSLLVFLSYFQCMLIGQDDCLQSDALEKGAVDGIRFVDADNVVLLEHLQQFVQGNGNV